MAPKPKHDYDGEEFYQDIFANALNGFSDAEIADALDLTPAMFSCMKNGNYNRWNEEENARRSERIANVLTRARRKTNALVRGRYLKVALGGIKVKSQTTKYVQEKCECLGTLKECPKCGGTGWITLTDKTIIQETSAETAPNIQALAVWLHHHDEEWRKGEKDADEDVPQNVSEGVDIDNWIKEQVK